MINRELLDHLIFMTSQELKNTRILEYKYGLFD